MSTETQLAIVPPKETALQVFQAANGLDPYLQQIRAEIDGFTPDVSTKKGRDAIASIAHKVARSKTALDNVGKELVADLKEIPKKIDAERKRMRDLLDAWKDEVRAPLNEWEQAEADRVAKHQAGIDQINLRLEFRDLDAAELAANIEWLEGIAIGEHWDEFEAEAARAKDKALTALREALTIRQKHEAELAAIAKFQAEQAQREQKERDERIAREAAEQAQREAEQRAQAERDAAAKREADAKAAAEQRELQLKLEAEQSARRELEAQQRAEQAERDAEAKAQAAAAAERQRQADEQARIEAEAKAREADKAHKAAINRAALEAFVAGGMTEECAKQAVTLIAKRQIPGVSIHY
ncbi:hypothetical protein N5J76_03150 [Pseudomonas sp. GD03855]|nr:hypothetical protein [Pseudomonas sp. GD03856]MDH2263917.1 hypothetical protein [Pseudomonas sp. GD03855]